MPDFKFACPQCGQKIECDSRQIGARVNCPACQQAIVVPPAPSDDRVIHIKIKVATLRWAAMIGVCVLLVAVAVAFAMGGFSKVTVLKGASRLNSHQAYRPPVEITVVAKTDSTNLRLAYAADQIIFNWEGNPSQLRVDGGPANGLHQSGAGSIPVGKYVTIKWVVTTTHQAIYVDGRLRFEHHGDYSQIVRPVTVFPANGSVVTVKSMRVRPIPDSTP